jgi:hypothetical protein
MLKQVDNTPPIYRQLFFTKPKLQNLMGLWVFLFVLTIITGFIFVEWYVVLIFAFLAMLIKDFNIPMIIAFRNYPAQLIFVSILGYIIFYILLLTL